MILFTSLSLVLPLLLIFFGLGRASPLADEQLREFLESKDASVTSLSHLARRDAQGIKPRHLRPEEVTPTLKKRDSISGADVGQIADFHGSDPQPERGPNGASFLSNSNHQLDAQNLDGVAGPTTDAGTVPNLNGVCRYRIPACSKVLVREQTITDLPPSKDIAGAELRLAPNAYRELHWHRVAEWGYILGGTGRIVLVDENGKSFESDIKGPTNTSDPDIYYFPPGVPHSIQALDQGLEILLIFTDGNFDALGTTFMLSDWLAHTPLEVIAKNFGVNTSTFNQIPQKDPYILESTVPPPGLGKGTLPSNPQGPTSTKYVFSLSQQEKQVAPGGGGWVKIQDSATNFPVSTDLASALVFVEPNGMRELHWHTADEWLYVISGTGRATAFAGSSTARTFDFQPGDTGVFPVSYGHYMENTSPTEPLIFLELFKASKFVDFSATQWLALTPPQIVADLLNISVETVESFKKQKQIIVS